MTFFVLFGLTAVVFSMWTTVVAVTLFGHLARIKERTGRRFAGRQATLGDFAHWWHSPALWIQRVLLIVLTGVLTGLIAFITYALSALG